MSAARAVGEDPEPLFGRSDIVAEVDRFLDAARTGTGGGLLLVGTGGIGKTPLVNLAVRHARERGFRVLRGRALNAELPAPFSLLRQLAGSFGSELPVDAGTPPSVPDRFPLPAASPGRVDRRSGGDSTTPAEPARALDELEQLLIPLGRSHVEGLGAVRAQLYGRLADYFLGLARERPLLIAVDDLHFADSSSLELLASLAEASARTSVAILGSIAPPPEVPGRAREFLLSPTSTAHFRTVEIRPLLVSELAEFAAWILGAPPSNEDVLRWHAETNGNPLFAELLVRAETGSARGLRQTPSESGGLLATLLARARSLDEPTRRVLTYAAVLGREFGFSTLVAVTGVDEERVTEAVDRLVRAGVVRERGGEVYEFVSEGVRARLDAELTETRRRILHRRIGTALEAQGIANEFELARHFYLGRDDPKSVEYNLKAAESAGRSFAFEVALEHVERALAAERRRPDRGRRRELRLQTQMGGLLNELGNLPRASEVLEATVRLARQEPRSELELGRALLALAVNRLERSDYAVARPLAIEAAELLLRVGNSRDALSVHRTLGTIYWRLADFAGAEVEQRAALELAERERDPLELGHALVDVANTLGPRGPEGFEQARPLYERASALFDSVENHSARARVLMNLAVMERLAGRSDDALRTVERALAAAERGRTPIWIVYCLLNLGQWRAETGQVEAARAAIDRAERLARGVGEALAEQQIAMGRGLIAEAEGDWAGAEAHYRDALARARAMQLPSETAEMLFCLARVFHRLGRDDLARSRLAEARAGGLERFRPDLLGPLRALESSLGRAA